jgi:hypothetical protein
MTPLIERLMAKVVVSETGCFEWTGFLSKLGYGQIWDNDEKRKILVHRAMLKCMGISIPDGFVVDHLCRVRNCVNPEHLEAVRPQTNTLRGVGLTAVNAEKTHCPRGHAYDEVNTRVGSNGRRYCFICRKKQSAENYQKRKLSQTKNRLQSVSDCVTVP